MSKKPDETVDAAEEEAVAEEAPVLAEFVCVPGVNAVELGRPDGTLCRINAGDVHAETDARMVSELDACWALERV